MWRDLSPQVGLFRRHPVRLHAGQLGYFRFGEPYFHLDPVLARSLDIPQYLAACHEDAHRTTLYMRFSEFQHFLGFAEFAARDAGQTELAEFLASRQAEAIAASVKTQEGRATVNMLLRCCPNYMRHFDRLYRLFGSIEPYASGLKLFESILGPIPLVVEAGQRDDDFYADCFQTHCAAMIITTMALDSSILRDLRGIEDLSEQKWRIHLNIHGPDIRLEQLAKTLEPFIKAGDLANLHAKLAFESASKHNRSLDGKLGREHIEDVYAVETEQNFLDALRRSVGGDLGIEIVHCHQNDPLSESFPADWLQSVNRHFPLNPGLRAAWLETTFISSLYQDNNGNLRQPGPGRCFRMAVPQPLVRFEQLTRSGLWPLLEKIGPQVDEAGWFLAISFVPTDHLGAVAAVISVWSLEGQKTVAKRLHTVAVPVDTSIDDRPPGPRRSNRPWLVHVHGADIARAAPIEKFVREGDIAFRSLGGLNTFDVARSLDRAVAEGRSPVLIPTVTLETPKGSLQPKSDSWIVASSLTTPSPWRYTIVPACLDALERVIIERQTLSESEKLARLHALGRIIRRVDTLGPPISGESLQNEMMTGVLDPIPAHEWPAIALIHLVGRPVALALDQLLPDNLVTFPEWRLVPYPPGSDNLALIEKIFEPWLNPTFPDANL